MSDAHRLLTFVAARMAEEYQRLEPWPEDADPVTYAECSDAQRTWLSRIGIVTIAQDALMPPTNTDPKGSLADRIRYAFAEGERNAVEMVLQTAAVAYANHPDYDPSWAFPADAP